MRNLQSLAAGHICCDHCGTSKFAMELDWQAGRPTRSPNCLKANQICCEVPEPLENADVLGSQGWTRVWCSASWDTADEIARSINKANRPCVAATGMPALPYAVMARYRWPGVVRVEEDDMERARR